MEYEVIDIVFAVIIAVVAIRALVRGFVKELLSVLAVVLGVFAAFLFSGIATTLVIDLMGYSRWAHLIAFAGVFLVVFIVVKLIERALSSAIEAIHLDTLDHVFGLVLGVIEGVLLCFIVVLLIQAQPFVDPAVLIGESIFVRVLLPFLPLAGDLLPIGRTGV